MMEGLKIEVVENGFIVTETRPDQGMEGQQWAFESAQSLAEFVDGWGRGNGAPAKIAPSSSHPPVPPPAKGPDWFCGTTEGNPPIEGCGFFLRHQWLP